MLEFSYPSYLQTPHWREFKSVCLLSVYERASRKYRCDKCGELFPRTEMQVHHKHYRSLWHEQRKDVLVLCGDCHFGEHFLPITHQIPRSLNGSGDANDRRNAVLDALPDYDDIKTSVLGEI